MPESGLGRKRIVDKYHNPMDYLNEIIFPEEDTLERLKKEVIKKEKELKGARDTVNLQNVKINYYRKAMRKFKR